VTLETYQDTAELYLARRSEVNASRPLFTGDVLLDIAIPGIQKSGMAVVVAHPCSMRGKGGQINDRVMLAAVTPHDTLRPSVWASGYFDRAPMPDLEGKPGCFVVYLDNIGKTRAELINKSERIACLTQFGVNLLQQRLIHHLTRLEVPTWQLQQAFSHTYEEADLMEDWNDIFMEGGVSVFEATTCFEAFFRAERDGQSLQKSFQDAQRRSYVRTACRNEAARQVSEKLGGH